MHKSPTSVACCNQIHDCLLSKNSFRIGLSHEKSDVQRAAGGAHSELRGVALRKNIPTQTALPSSETIPASEVFFRYECRMIWGDFLPLVPNTAANTDHRIIGSLPKAADCKPKNDAD